MKAQLWGRESENAMTNALERALDVVSRAVSDDMTKAKIRALARGYDSMYYDRYSRAKILAVEPEFKFRLANPSTSGVSQSFDFAGKIDVLILERGQVKIVEHKTTSDSLEPGSDYWDRLTMDTQISAYHLGAIELGFDPACVVYDGIRKPGLSPKNTVPMLDDQGRKIVIDANGDRVVKANGEPRESGDTAKGFVVQTRLETIDEYEQRLAEDILSRPDFYFACREAGRLDSDLIEFLEDAWASSQQILYFRNRNIWPRNPSACTAYGICPYFGLCAGHKSIHDYVVGKRHAELEIEENGHQLLTNSRLGTLRTCLRKHKLAYEDCIRPAETPEALAFGSLFHAALEAWFNTLKEEGKTT